MRDLTTPLSNQVAAREAGFCELYDIYLKSAIVTPWGTTNILRLTDLPSGISFFTPEISPEAGGNQGVAQAYNYWPVKRDTIKSDAAFPSDKVQVTASNVTTEWAAMVLTINWYDTPFIIRKISTTNATQHPEDCAIIFSGQLDKLDVTERQVAFELSNDLTTLQAKVPRESMHTSCRHTFGDDLCTAIKYRTANYKAKTAGSSSTTTLINSADLTEDTGSQGAYGTELVNPLSDGAITASSQGGGITTIACTITAGSFTTGTGGQPIQVNTTNTPHEGDLVLFGGTTLPTGIASLTYYVAHNVVAGDHFWILDSTTFTIVDYTDAGTSVTFSEQNSAGATAAQVKTSHGGYWGLGNLADWGTNSQGFLVLPAAQAGLNNMALKPWITFDFGSAKAIGLWRLASLPSQPLETLVRMVQLGHSTDNSSWVFLRYLELGPNGGVYYDFNIPSAPSKRYWRLCVRTRWGMSFQPSLLWKVQAYIGSRNYWAAGTVTFDTGTATVALRGVSARVLQSYSGAIVVSKLPAAPANGDTFTIVKGCPRTFNACAERGRTEDFGGFGDLPLEAIVRP